MRATGLDALELAYQVAGIFLAMVALGAWRDRAKPHRMGRALFWGLYASSFLAGSHLDARANGVLVVALVLASGLLPARHSQRCDPSQATQRPSPLWRLALPVVLLPALTAMGSVVMRALADSGLLILDSRQSMPVALVAAALLALLVALVLLPASTAAALHQGRRLLDAIGPVAALPQLLAAFGAILAQAGLGATLTRTLASWWPQPAFWVAAGLYGGGMMLLSIVLGNAFAAFPIMTVGVALPILVQQHHADPAATAAIGMLCGYCGTLLSPLAANFNLVPVALLGLDDRLAVIKAQAPTALMLLAVNMALLAWMVPRG